MMRAAAFALSLLLAGCSTDRAVLLAPGAPGGGPYAYRFVDLGGTDAGHSARLERSIRERLAEAGLLLVGAEGARVEVRLAELRLPSGDTRRGPRAATGRIVSRVHVFEADGAQRVAFEVGTTDARGALDATALLERHAQGIVAELR
jgi:hypothetical protein